MRSRQLQECAQLYSAELTPQASALLAQLLAAKQGWGPRWRAALTAPLHRQTALATLTTRLALLTNRF